MTAKRAEKRRKNKQNRRKRRDQNRLVAPAAHSPGASPEVELVAQEPPIAPDHPAFAHFSRVFARFDPARTADPGSLGAAADGAGHSAADAAAGSAADSADDSASDAEPPARVSNKQRKLRDRLSVAQLKQIVERPDLVEQHDANSPDPALLVLLKAARNSVAVPDHWRDKRRYLQGKRGVEKPDFVLPKAIQETGVGELRQTGRGASLKAQQRQRVNPKMGRLDVDYQKLHAAFFRHMVKPRMTGHGDIYYQGKEREVRYRKHRPGCISKRLRNALHMLDTAPPPYLLNMQRFGPPPSYPELRIPGLNAPIPPGAKYGYGEGQWGKPPVDESGYPLYGDPFGVSARFDGGEETMGKRPLWGELEESAAFDEGWEDAEMDEGGELDDGAAVLRAPSPEPAQRPAAPPERPAPAEAGPERQAAAKQLYRVLEATKVAASAKGLLGSAHTYELGRGRAPRGEEQVEVALSGLELESLDEMTIKNKYEESMRQSVQAGGAQQRGGRKGRGDKEISEFKF